MRFLVVFLLGISVSAQTTLQSPVVTTGAANGQFRWDFGISAPCPGGTVSAPGQATICGNSNSVTVSINGGTPFILGPGQPGAAATIVVGGTVTGAPGTAAVVTNSGTSSNAILNFRIPQGAAGPPGPQGPKGADSTVPGPSGPAATITIGTVSRGSKASVTNSGTSNDAILDFVLPEAALPVDYPLVVRGSRTPASTIYWNMPDPVSELFNDIVRVQLDLTNAMQTRAYLELGQQHGPSASLAFCQYSPDGGQTWNQLTNAASAGSPGSHVSAWAAVPANAKTDVLVRAVSQNGGGNRVDIKGFHLQIR